MFYTHEAIRRAFWNGVDFEVWWFSCKCDDTFNFGLVNMETVIHWKARFNIVMHEMLLPLMVKHTVLSYPPVG